MEFYVTNRDVIKNLRINTGTSANPVWTLLCTTSELSLNTSFNEKNWYVFCDAIERSINTGVAMTLEGTIKIDINSQAVRTVIGDIHTLLSSGEISQFNNVGVKFDLLSGVTANVLEYTTYQANTKLTLESIGGSAEDEGEFSFTMTINGTATTVSA